MSDADAPHLSRRVWIMIGAAAAIVTLSMGIRQAFGLFLAPLTMDMGIDRQTFGFIVAVQNLLFGLAQPFVGALADRRGAGVIAVAGALAYAIGLTVAGLASSALGLTIGLGVLTGTAMSGAAFVVVLGAVGKVVPAHRRTLAFGLVTAGGSLGQFLVVPLTQALIDAFDWRVTLFGLAALVALVIPLAVGVAGKPPAADHRDGPALKPALAEAFAHPSFWMLNFGFFVCGFQLAFVGFHLPAYLRDGGLDPSIGAACLALIGLFNIAGSWLWGAWGSKGSKKGLLALLYGLRGLSMIVFVLVPLSSASALVFAAVSGFLWLGTLPLTNGLVAQIYGLRHLSALAGIVFLSHQVGAFLGAWLAGLIFDATGSYSLMWIASIALALTAPVANLPIKEAPLVRTALPAE